MILVDPSVGIDPFDAHLLASARVAGRVSLGSRDKRLMAAAAERALAYAAATA